MKMLTRGQDLTIDYLIKENLKLKQKLGEADDAVEYWQIECDKRSKVLDKIKEYIKEYKNCVPKHISDYILELLEDLDE